MTRSINQRSVVLEVESTFIYFQVCGCVTWRGARSKILRVLSPTFLAWGSDSSLTIDRYLSITILTKRDQSLIGLFISRLHSQAHGQWRLFAKFGNQVSKHRPLIKTNPAHLATHSHIHTWCFTLTFLFFKGKKERETLSSLSRWIFIERTSFYQESDKERDVPWLRNARQEENFYWYLSL